MNTIPDNPEMPSKALREQVIEKLKLQFAHDNLELEEFEQRLEMANLATDRTALVRLVEDLPTVSESSPVVRESASYTLNLGKVKNSGTYMAVLGGCERKGLWKPPRNMKIFCGLGGVDLDFTKAEIPPGETVMEMVCLLGGVDIKVPDGVNVEVNVLPILGGVDIKGDSHQDPQGPTIRINGLCLLGGVDVKYPKKKKRKKK